MGNMIKDYLQQYIKKRTTLLGIGPMSKNCVDVAIKLANLYEIPIFLIASRRQIDSSKFNGGYVNNWTTKDFANYVRKRDSKKKIILARDHGGPWQNPAEIKKKMNLEEAINSAKESFLEDIKCGFQMIHIDPSIDINGKINIHQILERLFDLYKFCWNKARELNKEIIFEIGTEEQSGGTNTQEELEFVLSSVNNFCLENKLPKPFFAVFQCGTKVMETKNVGSFDSPLRVKDEIPAEIQLPKILKACSKNNIFLKEHNCDYLSNEALSWHPRLGIHAANVAPEFGVTETKALLDIFERNNLGNLSDQFIEVSFKSMRWKKWMLPNSKTSKREKAIISGHYVFSCQEVLEIKEEARKLLKEKNIFLDDLLKKEIEKSIMRYLTNFRLIK